MSYTKRKIRAIDASFLLAGLVFAAWGLTCAWFGWPRGIRHGSVVAFSLFALASLFFLAFPAIWAWFPRKHPVNHQLLRYGNLAEVAARLDREMAGDVAASGPFRLAATLLVYDSGLDFRMVPYERIASVEVEKPEGEPATSLIVHTLKGRRYQWYPGWMQGTFDPEEVAEKIRRTAKLQESAKTNA
jgi:hypothetical protein